MRVVCRVTNDTSRIHMTRTVDGVMVPLYVITARIPKCANACLAAPEAGHGCAINLQSCFAGLPDQELILACPYSACLRRTAGLWCHNETVRQRRQVAWARPA
jgi:hypothetical protein